MERKQNEELSLELFAEELNGDLSLLQVEELSDAKAAAWCAGTIACASTTPGFCYMTFSCYGCCC